MWKKIFMVIGFIALLATCGGLIWYFMSGTTAFVARTDVYDDRFEDGHAIAEDGATLDFMEFVYSMDGIEAVAFQVTENTEFILFNFGDGANFIVQLHCRVDDMACLDPWGKDVAWCGSVFTDWDFSNASRYKTEVPGRVIIFPGDPDILDPEERGNDAKDDLFRVCEEWGILRAESND